MSGKQIKLFLVDGTPGGLTTAEITNWTGHVLSASRSDLADLVKRDEAQSTGAYILLGDDEAAVGNTRCYIGEADIVADRLRYHQREKDFWDRVVVITSKDANLGQSSQPLPGISADLVGAARTTSNLGQYMSSRQLISATKVADRLNVSPGTCRPAPFAPTLPTASYAATRSAD